MQVTLPIELVVSALVPLQFIAPAPVIAKVVEVAAVVEPSAAWYEEGKMTWLGSESVHVRSD